MNKTMISGLLLLTAGLIGLLLKSYSKYIPYLLAAIAGCAIVFVSLRYKAQLINFVTDVTGRNGLLAKTIGVLVVINLITLLVTEPVKLTDEKSFSIPLVLLLLSIAFVVFSFRWWSYKTTDENGNGVEETGYIDADEVGVIKFFGRPIELVSSGLPFAPLEVCEVVKLPSVVQQKEFPAEPQYIFRGDMKDVSELPANMRPPFRLTFRNNIASDEAMNLLGSEYSVTTDTGEQLNFNTTAPSDGLSKRVTAEIVPVVRWKIEDAIMFVQNIGNLAEANRQLEDELFAVLTRLLPNMSVGQALQNFKWINTILKKAAQDRTANWGISIEGAFLKMIPLNHSLNEAIALAAQADFQGRAERELIEQRGAGTAKAAGELERDTLKGRTEGLVAMAEALGIRGEEAIAQFVAGQLASGQGTIILGTEGITQLSAVAATLMKRDK